MKAELNTETNTIAIVSGHERGHFMVDSVDESYVFMRALLVNVSEDDTAHLRNGDQQALRRYLEPTVTSHGTFTVRAPGLLKISIVGADRAEELELGAGATFTEFTPSHPAIDWTASRQQLTA